jgi:hypothetical protein
MAEACRAAWAREHVGDVRPAEVVTVAPSDGVAVGHSARRFFSRLVVSYGLLVAHSDQRVAFEGEPYGRSVRYRRGRCTRVGELVARSIVKRRSTDAPMIEIAQSLASSEREFLSRIKVKEPPPRGFNPMQATSRDLARYGFPRRPDPKKEPRLAASWDKAMRRPFEVIKPELAVNHARQHRAVGGARRKTKVSNTTTIENWAGGIVLLADRPPITTIGATWIVPHPYPPDNTWEPAKNTWSDGLYYVSQWVGIGGFISDDADPDDSPDIVQAGTLQIVSVRRGQVTVTPSAWIQWASYETLGSDMTIMNFPAEPGDVISCFICAPAPTAAASLYIQNHGAQVATVVPIPPIDKYLVPTSGEFIVERSSVGIGGGAPMPTNLADFGTVFFYDLRANDAADLQQAILPVNMAAQGVTLAVADVNAAEMVEVEYVASLPP